MMDLKARIKELEKAEKNFEMQIIAVRGALQELRAIVAEEEKGEEEDGVLPADPST